jgi:hypothetical protein
MTEAITHTAVHIETRDIQNAVVYVYRCCGDQKTDSCITIYDPHRFQQADLDAQRQAHGTGVEVTHQYKLAAEAQVDAQIAAGDKPISDLAGAQHRVSVCSREHLADEIIAVTYLCCGTHKHREVIDRIHLKLPNELDAVMTGHLHETARGHANVSWKQKAGING